MRQRLEQFLAAENISQTQFAESINVARAGISHILSGRNKPSYEFIVNTMEAYPMLDIEWLLTGKGKMYKDNEASGSDGLLFSGAQLEKQTPAPAPAPTTIQPPVVKPQPQPQILPPVEKSQPQLQNQVEEPQLQPQNPAGKPQPQTRRISRIVALYEDNTFEEFISGK